MELRLGLRGRLRFREVEVVLSLETTFSVGVVGWVGVWLEKMGLRLSHQFEVEDELGKICFCLQEIVSGDKDILR